jgi:tetratricopeptide (TPR) repeat protein
MMRRAALAAAALAAALCLAVPAAAQSPLAIRAGDQSAMSRLVLDLPPGTQWLMDQDGRQVLLRFPAVALDFDTSAIFPDRKASRVLTARARAEATGTILMLTLACDCAAEAFTLGPRKLVVDLRDGPPAGPLARQDPPPPRPAPPAAATDEMPMPVDAAAPAPEAPGPAVAADPSPPQLPPAAESQPAPAESPDDAALRAEIDRARTLLMERLSRAAEEGLVDLRPPPPPPSAGDPALARSEPTRPPPPPDPGIEVRTAREDDRRAPEAPPTDPACLPDSALDLAAWGEAASPTAQIAQARAALVQEFDRIDRDALARLVRLYIHLGFGQEAEALLVDLGTPVPDAALLADLARLVEARAPSRDSRLLAAWPCPGRAALWGMLARLDPATAAPPPDMAMPDPADVQTALAELPPVLRRLVGPRLAHGYLALGRPDLAEGLLLRVRAVPGDPGDDYHLAEAALLDALGRHDAAEAIWSSLVGRDRPNAAAAMIALTESRVARGLEPPPGLAEDLATRAFERRRSEEGARLTLAEIEARAAEGDLAMALGLIRQELEDNPGREDELRAAAARTLARADPERVGPAVYVAAVLGHEDLLARDAGADPARLVTATALTGLGLPNAALGLIDPAMARGSDAVRLTAARALIALGQTDRAADALSGIDTEEAATLRAQAHARAGDHAAALAALPDDAPDALRAEYAFAAGEWERATGLADPVDRVLAAFMAGADPTDLPALAGDAAEAEPLRAFLAPPRLEEPISLDLARDAVDIARSTRELLKSRLAVPGG